jgi:hypothetical protein
MPSYGLTDILMISLSPSLSARFTHNLFQAYRHHHLSCAIRYKVRTEIARKSKDAESKLAVQRNSMSVLNASNSGPQSLSPSASQATLAHAESSPNGKLLNQRSWAVSSLHVCCTSR